MNLESRLRNATYIGELTKFRIYPTLYTFDCVRACFEDFHHHNIDVLCCLLERCGRWLHRNPETHVRLMQALDKMMAFHNNMVGVAEYSLDASNLHPFLPPCFQFIGSIICGLFFFFFLFCFVLFSVVFRVACCNDD